MPRLPQCLWLPH